VAYARLQHCPESAMHMLSPVSDSSFPRSRKPAMRCALFRRPLAGSGILGRAAHCITQDPLQCADRAPAVGCHATVNVPSHLRKRNVPFRRPPAQTPHIACRADTTSPTLQARTPFKRSLSETNSGNLLTNAFAKRTVQMRLARPNALIAETE